MIDLEAQYLKMLREILGRYVPDHEVRLFGSRARGTARPFSDIDLVIIGPADLPEETLYALRDAFADSNLPYRVDVLDWHVLTPEFRKSIEDWGFVVIQKREGV